MRNQSLYERAYKNKLKSFLDDQETEALKNLEAKAAGLKKELGDNIFDKNEADKKLVEEIVPVLESLAVEQGALALAFAGAEDTEFVVTEAVRAFIRDSTAKMASNFNEETLAALNDTLTEGVIEGEGLSKLKKRVAAVYEKSRGYRSERLARTETLKASNNVTNLAYKQTGYVKKKRWYANPGHCAICGALDGKTIVLDESYAELGQSIEYTDEDGNVKDYPINYDTLQNPPVHPNCRCTIIPVR